MPYQNQRYLPPIATPVVSRYQIDFIKQDVSPPNSFKSRNVTNLPPIAYSNCRRKVGKSSYKDSYQGTFGYAADTAKPDPYEYPSKDNVGTSTYRDNFRKTKTLQLPLLPTSPTRRNNPHPTTMNNAFHFPNRGYWVWPHYLLPVKYDSGDDSHRGPYIPEDLTINKIRGPFDTWEENKVD